MYLNKYVCNAICYLLLGSLRETCLSLGKGRDHLYFYFTTATVIFNIFFTVVLLKNQYSTITSKLHADNNFPVLSSMPIKWDFALIRGKSTIKLPIVRIQCQ